MLVGAGALRATDEVIEVAEVLGAGVSKALLGRTAIPDDLPFCCGPIGLLGSKPSWDMMQECDTLLMVGSSFPYSEFLSQEGRARGVQIDIDAKMLSLRYPMEVNLVGDSAETLHALLPYLERKTDRSWREKLEREIKDWWKLLEARAMQSADPINPQRVFWELSPRLPDNCIVTADSGSTANWFARDLKFRRGMMASLSGTLATMGPGVPYAIAGKFNASQQVPDFPFAKYAEDLGLIGMKVEDPKQVGPAWDKAFSAARPVVLEIVTDPEVPTLPPHITFKQAKNFMASLPRDPSAPAIVRDTVKDVVAGLVPHKD